MKTTLFTVVLLASTCCFAQSTKQSSSTLTASAALPDAPSTSAAIRTAEASTRITKMELANREQTTGKYKLNSKYWAVIGLMAVGTIADVETTAAKVHECSGAKEVNSWLYGSRPTRGRMYGINIPIMVGTAWLAAIGKRDKKDGGQWHSAWPILAYTLTGVHGLAAVHNAGVRC